MTVDPKQYVLHKLALKIALVVAGAAVLLSIGLGFLAPWPIKLGLLFSGLIGLITYVVVQRLLAPRLQLAQASLRKIRKHQFEELETTPSSEGDELNGLIQQVYRTGQAVEREIEELRKVENYRREFLGDVSHELKTPIFAIRGFAETLQNGALEDPKVNKAFVEKIMRNADRLSNLTQDLADISRIETGELQMTIEPFDLRRMVHDVAESLEPIAKKKGVTLQYKVPEELPPVLGDTRHIRQVLVNLTDNAIKYNNPGGYVEVIARLLPSDQVKISVIDNGIGLTPEDISRLTERFYRVDKSRSRAQGGTGLGLAIVKHILGAHNQLLAVESNPGRGSTFGFTLKTFQDTL